MDKLYSLQKDGEDIKLPSGFKPKIDANVIVDQLQLYRDHGFGVDIQSSDKQKQNVERQDRGSPAAPASPANTSNNKQNVQRQDRGSPMVTASPTNASNNKQNVPKTDVEKQSQDSGSSNSDVPRTDMRRQWQDPDSPPGSPNNHRVPRTNFQKHIMPQGSPVKSIRLDIKDMMKNLKAKKETSESQSLSSIANNGSVSQNLNARNSQSSVEGNSGNRSVTEKKGFAAKLAAAAPYNFFLTAIRDSPPTHREPLSVCFHQLLDPSMGDLDCSLQINFMVELDWLMEQYKVFGHE